MQPQALLFCPARRRLSNTPLEAILTSQDPNRLAWKRGRVPLGNSRQDACRVRMDLVGTWLTALVQLDAFHVVLWWQ